MANISNIKNTIASAIGTGSSEANGTDVPNASPTSQTILVTGASGFVAAHVVNAFLSARYNVRGTVRSEETAEKVRRTHAAHQNQLSFAIVQDIAAPGAFDEAVKGVDGVIHTASPFQTDVQDNERDLLQPAIKGTVGLLESVQRNAQQVKRVVVTSSFAAILDLGEGARPGHTYTERDWNPVTYETAKDGPGAVAYCGSKTFAEKAAFEYVDTHKPNFSVATICPPMIYGPLAHEVSSLNRLNTSAADVYRLMNGSLQSVPETSFFAFADVRDVAAAHLKAYENPAAAGQRYFVTSGNYTYDQICDVIREEFPQIRDRVPAQGDKGKRESPDVYKVDASKASTELKLEMRGLRECIRDTVTSFLDLERKLGKDRSSS